MLNILPLTYELDTCAKCDEKGEAEYFIPELDGGYHAQFSNLEQVKFVIEACNNYYTLQQQNTKMREALELMRSALSFYADSERYTTEERFFSTVFEDKGEIARLTLNSIIKEETK